MAVYDRSAYYLEFQDDYKKVNVFDNDEALAAAYNLEASGQCVRISIEDDDYIIGYATAFTTPTNTIDVAEGATLSFVSDRMGGIGSVDLQDMKPGGPYYGDIEYNLACSAVHLRYVEGSFAFWVYCQDTDCISFQEV